MQRNFFFFRVLESECRASQLIRRQLYHLNHSASPCLNTEKEVDKTLKVVLLLSQTNVTAFHTALQSPKTMVVLNGIAKGKTN
jgi:hypothetical protein